MRARDSLVYQHRAIFARERNARNGILLHIQDVREHLSRTAGPSTLACTISRDPVHDNQCAVREAANSCRPELICYRLHSARDCRGLAEFGEASQFHN